MTEYKVLASEKYKNMEVVAGLVYGIYSILAYKDGVLVGSYDTENKEEAMEVYDYNIYNMLAM